MVKPPHHSDRRDQCEESALDVLNSALLLDPD